MNSVQHGRQRVRRQASHWSGYWRPAWVATLVLVAILSVRLAELLPVVPRLRPALIAMVVVVPLILVQSGAWARLRAIRDRTILLLLLYAAWATIGIPFALHRGGAFEHIRTIPNGTLVVLAFLLCVPTRLVMDRLALGFVLLATATCAVAYLQGHEAGGRLTTAGAFDPNDLASLAVVALPFALALVLRGPAKGRFLGAVCTAILGLAFVSTGSRGGMIGLVVALLVLTAGMNKTRAFVAVALVAILSPIAWHVAPPAFRVQMASLTAIEADYNVTEETGRLGTWKRGVGYTLQHPITGVGIGNFSMAEGERWRRLNRPGRWLTAHNAYVQAFAELGFPGGLLFLALLGNGFLIARRLWRSPDLRRPEYLAALAGFSAAAVFLSHAYAYHLFALLGLLAHAGHVVSTRQIPAKTAHGAAASAGAGAARRGGRRTRLNPVPARALDRRQTT